MSEHVPHWLGKALSPVRGDVLTPVRSEVRPGHAKLVIASLGSEALLGRDGFRLTSAAFEDGEELDPCFTAEEDDSVAPPLEWTQPPAGTREMVLLVEDPDAPGAEPFCHWLVWGLAPQRGKLLEGETPPRVGKNAFGNSEWLLPDPPEGQDSHDYVFQLFALDTELSLMPGATRKDVVAAMEGHVIGAAVLTGTYARGADADEVDWDGDGA
jgi:Raf kinase inhibitor-like YbhB/YbcL family protein